MSTTVEEMGSSQHIFHLKSTSVSIRDSLEEFRRIGKDRNENEEIELRIFNLSKNKLDHLDVQRFIRVVRGTGLHLHDPRLDEIRANLDDCQNFIIENIDDDNVDCGIDFDCFKGIIANNTELLNAAFDQQFVISDFTTFQGDIRHIFQQCWEKSTGEVSSYTDYLGDVNPDHWGASICSVDGQRVGFGNNTSMFTLQALMNPFLYALSLDEHGEDEINSVVGQESSGAQYNIIRLDENGKPHNPMVNAGGLLLASKYKSELSQSVRHREFLQQLRKIAGMNSTDDNTIGFDYSAFMSERANCHRNCAITYYLREKNCLQGDASVDDIIDVYTQMCNLTVNCDSLSVLAATLANGGICPITGEKCLSSTAVQSTLSCMLAAGMNDYSGQWAFIIGLPAKSGISGGTMVVVPNVMGIALYSPRVDKSFNSVRGIDFTLKLVETFHFHEYDPIRIRSKTVQSVELTDTDKLIIILLSAARNDVPRLMKSYLENFDMNQAGYDGKTALHAAASHGNVESVHFLVEICCVDKTLRDRRGRTALDYAEIAKHDNVKNYLSTDNIMSRSHDSTDFQSSVGTVAQLTTNLSDDDDPLILSD